MSVKIEINKVSGITASIKDGKVKLVMETDLHPGDLARLINLSRQGAPISAVIESPQASLDLVFREVEASQFDLDLGGDSSTGGASSAYPAKGV